MVIATACWASTMIANKSIINLLAVTEINSMRFLIGAVTMFLVAGAAGQLAPLQANGRGPAVAGLPHVSSDERERRACGYQSVRMF